MSHWVVLILQGGQPGWMDELAKRIKDLEALLLVALGAALSQQQETIARLEQTIGQALRGFVSN